MNRLYTGFLVYPILIICLISPFKVFAKSVPMVQSVMVHFAELPPIQLPCGDLKLFYHPDFVKNSEILNIQKIELLRTQHEKLLQEADKFKIEIAKALEDFLLAGYAYFREKNLVDKKKNPTSITSQIASIIPQTASDILQKTQDLRIEAKFLYQQLMWYSTIAHAAYNDYAIRQSAEEYYKLITPLFKHLNYSQRVDLIEKFSKRLACLHEHRQEAFDIISKAQRYSAKELSDFTENEYITIEQASRRAKDIASFSSFHREYTWMAAEAASLTGILRLLHTAHGTALLNTKLFPKLMGAHEKYGAALGPADKFPKDKQRDETRRIRLEITKIRAQIALNYMKLKQVQAEKVFTSQLNLSSGMTAGLSQVGPIAEKAYKDFMNTYHLFPSKKADKARNKKKLTFDLFLNQLVIEPLTVNLSLIAIAYESAGSSFVLVGKSVLDTVLKWQRSATGFKTSSEKALDTFLPEKKKIDFSIKVIEKLMNDLDPDKPDAFGQGQALMAFIVIGKPFNSHLAKQVPNEIRRLLEDPGFIGATGGGLGWILAPLCESPTQRSSLLTRAARFELTGNARSAFHRIAFDKKLWIENPDLPLTRESLKKDSLSNYAESDFEKKIVQATQNWITEGMYGIPMLGAAKFVYDKTLVIGDQLRWEKKNQGSHDEFILNLISQQDLFDQVLAALKRVRYNFSTLSLKEPHSFSKHLSLLVQSPEYLAAYIKIRHAFWERSKMFNAVRYSKETSDRFESEGKAILAGIDRAHELETVDLTVKMASLKMEHHLSSMNYIAAAQELKALETAENIRRSAYGIKGTVDLSEEIALFNKESRLSEVWVSTSNLIKELVIQRITAGLLNVISNSIILKLPAHLGVKTIPLQKAILHKDLLNTINPWFGKFSAAGVWEVMSGGVSDAVVESATQLTLTHLKLDKKKWEASLNQFFTYTTKLGTSVGGQLGSVTIESFRTRTAVKKRLDALFEIEEQKPVQKRLDHDNQVNADLLFAISKKDWKQVKALKKEVAKRAERAAIDSDLLRYKRLRTGIEDAIDYEQHLKTSNKNNAQTLEAGEVAKSHILKKIPRHTDDNDVALNNAGRLVSITDFKQEMNTGTPSISSLKRLIDTRNEAGLHKHLLTDGFDIYLIRKGLQAAKDRVTSRMNKDEKNSTKYKAELKQIDHIASEIDDKRIDLINNNLEEFFNHNPEHKNMVVSVVQGGAAKGNPEYQGIFGDIDFTILTRPGADGVKIKKDMEAFFKEKGHPMATKQTDGHSPMDTEAFIQGIGNFDASKESLTNIITDVSVKMGDPTRFYSEAGGKWFINNMAYSGKTLWGQKQGEKKWAHITKGEAHGLALDMTRYLSFLTDPKYESKKIAAMKDDPAAQRKTLESALKKTKYFIRLIDAYMISHDKGNDLYHKRMSHKKKIKERNDAIVNGQVDDDASYHWQIYKDAQRLIKGGHKTIFKPGDLAMIKAMAKMKMKGKHPSPFDALEEGSDKVKFGIEMVARMEELAADIMAHTAQAHLDETLQIVKSGTPEERKIAFSDQMRKVSTSRKIGEGTGSKPLMMPKAEIIDVKGVKTLVTRSIKDQVDLILQRMADERLLRDIRNQHEQQINSLILAQPKDDPRGLTTRLKVAKLIEKIYGKKNLVPKADSASLENLQHDSYLYHYKLYWALAGRLIKGLGKPSKKGTE